MNKETKNKINNIFTHRLSENKNLPQKQQFEHIVSRETIDSEYKYENTTKKLLKLEIGLCQECQSSTYVIDYHRGERVCPECGYVFNNTVFEKPRYIIHNTENTIYPQKYMKFTNNKKYLYMTEAKKWKEAQIQREIDVISTSLQLSKYNKEKLKEIIKAHGLKKLHSKANVTTIICAVARYLLKNTKNNPLVSLRYDRGVFETNLSRQEYEIVEKNIYLLFGDKYAYNPKTKKKKPKNRKKRKSKSKMYNPY